MSKIRDAFADGKVFIPFLTAGDPNLDLNTTERGINCILPQGKCSMKESSLQ